MAREKHTCELSVTHKTSKSEGKAGRQMNETLRVSVRELGAHSYFHTLAFPQHRLDLYILTCCYDYWKRSSASFFLEEVVAHMPYLQACEHIHMTPSRIRRGAYKVTCSSAPFEKACAQDTQRVPV